MTQYLFIGIFALTTVAGIFGWRHEAIKFRDYREAVAAAAQAQEKETERIKAQHDRATKEASDSYNKRVADLRSYYAARVSGESGGSKMPAPANTATGTNGYTPDNLPSTPVLASQCAETTLMLTSLQDWAEDISKE